MGTLKSITDAALDPDLRDRLISAAAEVGITSPTSWVDQRARALAASPIAEGSTDTIASVYAYALATRPLPPGQDPAAVSDDYIRFAVAHLQTN